MTAVVLLLGCERIAGLGHHVRAPDAAVEADGSASSDQGEVAGADRAGDQDAPSSTGTDVPVVPGGPEQEFPGFAAAAPDEPYAVARPSGVILVFYRGNDGNLWRLEQSTPGGAFGKPIAMGFAISSRPTAVLGVDDAVEVFARLPGHAMGYFPETARGVWEGPRTLGGSIKGDVIPLVHPDRSLTVFGVTTSGAVLRICQTSPGGSWVVDDSVGLPQGLEAGSDVAAAAVPFGSKVREALAVKRLDHELHIIEQQPSGTDDVCGQRFRFDPWGVRARPVMGRPAAGWMVSQGSAELSVFYLYGDVLVLMSRDDRQLLDPVAGDPAAVRLPDGRWAVFAHEHPPLAHVRWAAQKSPDFEAAWEPSASIGGNLSGGPMAVVAPGGAIWLFGRDDRRALVSAHQLPGGAWSGWANLEDQAPTPDASADAPDTERSKCPEEPSSTGLCQGFEAPLTALGWSHNDEMGLVSTDSTNVRRGRSSMKFLAMPGHFNQPNVGHGFTTLVPPWYLRFFMFVPEDSPFIISGGGSASMTSPAGRIDVGWNGNRIRLSGSDDLLTEQLYREDLPLVGHWSCFVLSVRSADARQVYLTVDGQPGLMVGLAKAVPPVSELRFAFVADLPADSPSRACWIDEVLISQSPIGCDD
jgi:hypothetical protein